MSAGTAAGKKNMWAIGEGHSSAPKSSSLFAVAQAQGTAAALPAEADGIISNLD